MLQRGGVERHLRPVLGEDRVYAGRVADVGKHDVRGVQEPLAVDRQLDGVQCRLVPVEQHQLTGAVLVDLSSQLRADRATGSGDEHDPVGQVAGDLADVRRDLVASEQVGDIDLPDVAEP